MPTHQRTNARRRRIVTPLRLAGAGALLRLGSIIATSVDTAEGSQESTTTPRVAAAFRR